MKKYKIGIVGRFGFGMSAFGGQSIKTRNLSKALSDKIGEDNILCVDTREWQKHPFKLLCNIRKATSQCESVIILPADRGVKVIPKLTLICNQDAKLFYSVIGGWLPKMTETNKRLRKTLKKYDGIWVEALAMKKAMEEQGFSNISVVPNFKNITPLKPNELVYQITEPYKLCTFSRVLKEKGIEDIVDVVRMVNEQSGRVVFDLDIYGQVDAGYIDRFAEMQQRFPEYIHYRGKADGNNSTAILKNYYALVFPTRYYTEGIPGTIIDSYAAGIPVISSQWANFSDIVDEGKIGFGYEYENLYALKDVLIRVRDNPQLMADMKTACLEKAKEYTLEHAVEIIWGGIAVDSH